MLTVASLVALLSSPGDVSSDACGAGVGLVLPLTLKVGLGRNGLGALVDGDTLFESWDSSEGEGVVRPLLLLPDPNLPRELGWSKR